MSTRPAAFLSAECPIGFAHRGGARLWPENTWIAFRNSMELGLTYLETDLQLSRDGEIVLFHDARLERTTNGSGLIADFGLAELKRLDAAYWFEGTEGQRTARQPVYPWRGRGARILTLVELLTRAPTARVNVEIKASGGPLLAAALARLIERHGWEERLLVASATHSLVRRFRLETGGTVVTSASRRECLAFWMTARLGRQCGRGAARESLPYAALQLPARVRGRPFITAPLVAQAHASDVQVHAWTVDDASEMDRLIAIGVDGIMTDRPDLWAARQLRSC